MIFLVILNTEIRQYKYLLLLNKGNNKYLNILKIGW